MLSAIIKIQAEWSTSVYIFDYEIIQSGEKIELEAYFYDFEIYLKKILELCMDEKLKL